MSARYYLVGTQKRVFRSKIMFTFIEDESGATTIEYGMIFGLLSSAFYYSAVSISAYVEQTFSVL